MYKQIGLTDLISAIQKKIEDHTGTKCYDAVTKNAPSPFYCLYNGVKTLAFRRNL